MKPNLKNDVLASVVVFLVALPLSLGIALASGAPIIAGVIAAAVGGIVAGSLGGAPLQVSGPAAGLTVIVYGVVQKFGWSTACVVTLVAGLIQLVLGFSRVARLALGISPAVVHGMLAGIGVTIAVAQFQVVLGSAPQSGVLKNLAHLPENLSGLNPAALAIGAFTIAILLLWPKMPKAIRSIPAPLVAVAVPTVVSVLVPMDLKRINLPQNVLSGIQLPTMPDTGLIGGILSSALVVALVASVESLLSAVATDKMHNGKRANLDRELIGQGAANTISGLLGGLPVTGVIVRSSANIASGATTRRSAILHGVWIVTFVLLLGSLLRSIPMAALAGLLVHVGIKLVNKAHINELKQHRELPVYLVTLLGVVGIDLMAGVGLGLGLSLVMVLRRMAVNEVRLDDTDGVTRVQMNGTMTFLSVPRLVQTLNAIPQGGRVEVEMHTDFMDHAVIEAVHTWENGYRSAGGHVTIYETHEPWYEQAVERKPRVKKSLILPSRAHSGAARIVTREHALAQGGE